MLLEFTFENFKCYRDETTLSMEAASIEEHSASLIKDSNGRDILPVGVIYGPNGGGKSSVLQALECVRNHVIIPYAVLRQRDGVRRYIRCRPYAFESASRHAPTTFCVLFTKDIYTYRYILSIKDGIIEEEYLHRRMPGKGATAKLFEREGSSIELGSWLKRKRANTDVDEMMPYLTFLAINYDYEPIDDAFSWFLDCQSIDYSHTRFENVVIEPDDEEEKRRILNMLNNMDIDISDIRYVHDEDDSDSIREIYLKHANSENYELELQEESNGTQKLMGLIPMVLSALDRGSLLVSDEMDAKLHPKLIKYLVRLFTDRKTNPKGAQLIFTSHDMSTLTSSVFRRDEIWFAAKSSDETARLYSLSDVADTDGKRVRVKSAYNKQYLAGRYGADPYLKNMLEWDNTDE